MLLSHSGGNEEYHLTGYNAVYSGSVLDYRHYILEKRTLQN
jgi:hypothetical protein